MRTGSSLVFRNARPIVGLPGWVVIASCALALLVCAAVASGATSVPTPDRLELGPFRWWAAATG
jgi:hypothetical protein